MYAHQTTYGISERVLGAVVAVHGDDKGLMLPPAGRSLFDFLVTRCAHAGVSPSVAAT